jgi:hypothetical protein
MAEMGHVRHGCWVFGLLAEHKDCAGWDRGRFQALCDQMHQAWEEYDYLASRLPPPRVARAPHTYSPRRRAACSGVRGSSLAPALVCLMRTLPDHLDNKTSIVSIGFYASLRSVKLGFYFSNPRNRFWKAMNLSGLITKPITPCATAPKLLMGEHRIGLTNTVNGARPIARR